MPDARTRFQSPRGVQVREHSIPESTALRAHNSGDQQMGARASTPEHRGLIPSVLLAVVLGLWMLMGSTGSAAAQDAPDPESAMRAFNAARSWVDALDVAPEGDAGDVLLPDGPASLTLRYAGRVVGRGSSFAPGSGVALRQAAARAIREATDRVQVPADPDLRREFARSLAMSLELASVPVPVSAESMKDLAITLSLGIHGVSARLGDRTEGFFPGTMLATGMEPREALGAVAAAVTGASTNALRDPAQVRRDLGVSFATFRTTHIAQSGPGASPVFLYRGSRVPTAAPPTAGDLLSLADRIAANLMAREADEGKRTGMGGTYQPLSDTFDSETASPIEQGLVAIALARYATLAGAENDAAEVAGRVARRLVDDLAVVVPGEIAPDGSATGAAMVSIAVRRVMPAGEGRSEAVRRMLEACDARMDGAADDTLSAPERAFVAWGLAARARETSDADHFARATRAVREAFVATPVPMLVGQMPWLVWAELDLTTPDVPVPAAEALRQMRTLVWTHQLRPEDGGDDGADMVGGILFTGTANPLPTAQSLRAIAAAGTMMADGRLTERGELPRELSRMLGGLRFLDALVADEPTCHMYMAPARAIGGVRASLWDQRMTPESGALALLILCDTLGVVAPAGPAPIAADAAPVPRAQNP